ncbi:hypothetical protein C3L33_04782, partial [Rhododendron williamsianum]
MGGSPDGVNRVLSPPPVFEGMSKCVPLSASIAENGNGVKETRDALIDLSEFTIVLEDVVSNRNNGNQSPGSPNDDRKRQWRPYNSKTFKVEISFAAKIPMQSIANALWGQESENSQEALRVLDIILRQHASKQ